MRPPSRCAVIQEAGRLVVLAGSGLPEEGIDLYRGKEVGVDVESTLRGERSALGEK